MPAEGQHDGIADSNLAVTDQTILGGHSRQLFTPERLRDEVEESPGVVGDDPGGGWAPVLPHDRSEVDPFTALSHCNLGLEQAQCVVASPERRRSLTLLGRAPHAAD
ncbi:hypothetical protein GCM10010339_88740 [Streptomyces alanosinicus]|uniref:Uncharacterized protein n=1 Tax=Streptomyces alanosinicus TaxID=68171 RepID=A0A918YU17_9ACTN|nr:hypothetical protein GCM10010339_88740 [Streptomyces alanosinicus]